MTSSGGTSEVPWRRLSVRVVWVDLAQSVLSLLPGAVAWAFLGMEASWGNLWPLAMIAVVGVVGAALDIVRWAFTRYRVTDTEVERWTGVLVRRRRSVRRDRLRSVDTHAKLRHRVAGLRVVSIGAGQQTGTGQAALLLDALAKDDAARLRRELLDDSRATADASSGATFSAEAAEPAESTELAGSVGSVESAEPAEPAASHERTGGPAAVDEAPSAGTEAARETVLATFRPGWVVYNMFSIWGYLMAAGLLWGAFWLVSMVGVDLWGMVAGAVDWESLGWLGITVVALLGGGAIGAVGMGVNYFTSYWGFELARVRSNGTSHLRTRRGLFSTREVSRDEGRMRGLTIAEPLLWRWMGMADTDVITTGLNVWDPEQPTALLPRGPIGVAREVAVRVLGEPSPLTRSLPRHPLAALRRRLWWGTAVAAVAAGFVAVPVATGAAPSWVIWAALALWPVGLLGGLIAYRALGHAVVGDYVVVRSGLMSRSTSALRRDAVSTIAVRQSILQKRLGLSTVSAMTAAGWGAYEAPDVATHEAVTFAAAAAPGLLDEFLVDHSRDRSFDPSPETSQDRSGMP